MYTQGTLLFERPQSGERAVLVHINFASRIDQEDILEFRELAVSAGAIPVAEVTSARRHPDPKYLMGTAKAQEVLDIIAREKADLVLVNHELSPTQERNLERFLSCQVLDRTGLILDIFAQRAKSHAGRLQVELAQLQHIATRLVRGWTHLERQKGGIGLRGPGETQLETDRRLIGIRIKQLNKRLKKVRNSRGQGRKSRQKAAIPTVSLVGYTNAGKSTLFNRLTASDVHVANQLFATLDPTLRRLELPGRGPVILADTVGFIRQLPHDLIEAFQSTLEETREADLLLHVVDANHNNYQEQIEQVNLVLQEIDAADIRQLQVFNKVDLLDGSEPHIDYDEEGNPKRVWLSAATGDGVDLLINALTSLFSQDMVRTWIQIGANHGSARAKVFARGKVLDEQITSNGDVILEVILNKNDVAYIHKHYDVTFLDPVDDDQIRAINYCG